MRCEAATPHRSGTNGNLLPCPLYSGADVSLWTITRGRPRDRRACGPRLGLDLLSQREPAILAPKSCRVERANQDLTAACSPPDGP